MNELFKNIVKTITVKAILTAIIQNTRIKQRFLCHKWCMLLFQVKKRTKKVSELFQSYHPYTHKVIICRKTITVEFL